MQWGEFQTDTGGFTPVAIDAIDALSECDAPTIAVVAA
jgi:hypothetical protein